MLYPFCHNLDKQIFLKSRKQVRIERMWADILTTQRHTVLLLFQTNTQLASITIKKSVPLYPVYSTAWFSSYKNMF